MVQLDPAPAPHWMITPATPTNNATANRNADLSPNKTHRTPHALRWPPSPAHPTPIFRVDRNTPSNAPPILLLSRREMRLWSRAKRIQTRKDCRVKEASGILHCGKSRNWRKCPWLAVSRTGFWEGSLVNLNTRVDRWPAKEARRKRQVSICYFTWAKYENTPG